MVNTMYNINETNNQFEIITDSISVTKTIPTGNYSVKTYVNQTKSLININFIVITYNKVQNTYTFTTLMTTSNTYNFKPITLGKLIRITDNIEYEIGTLGYTTGLVNLINYNKVIVQTENISYYYNNVENIRTNTINSVISSDIIFWKSKSDIELYKILKYNNEDGGNSFGYKIENR